MSNPPNINVPFFWPLQLAAGLMAQGLELSAHNLKFMDEEIKLHGGINRPLKNPPPTLA